MSVAYEAEVQFRKLYRDEMPAGVSPWDTLSEEAREHFRRSLSALELDKRKPIIAVCSTTRGEGVSWVTAMLTCAAAEQVESVIVVDANRRNAVMEQLFAVAEHASDTQRVQNRDGNGIVTCNTGWPGIEIMRPEGDHAPAREITELLLSLRRIDKTVLVDCEAMQGSSQLLLLAPALDGVVFVVEAGRERRAAVAQAITEIRRAQLPILGVIINKMKPAAPGFVRRVFSKKKKNIHVAEDEANGSKYS